MVTSLCPSTLANTCQQIEASALGRNYVTKRRTSVSDLQGNPVTDMAVVPPVYIHNVVSSMRSAATLPLTEIHTALSKAADFYQHDTIAGLSPDDYRQLVRRTTGLPNVVILNSIAAIANSLKMMPDIIVNSMPRGARLVWNEPDTVNGCSLFSRKGDVFGVLAAGNGPGIPALWPQAVALGYRVLVRPSTREPFTAQRVIGAMEKAGLENYVALIPTDYVGADQLVAAADFSMAYGGQDIVDKYINNTKVRVQGPGRSKIVIGSDANIDAAVSLVVRSMTDLGGAACVSTSAVLIDGNVTEFCLRLKQALRAVSPHLLPRVSEKSLNWLQDVLGIVVDATLTPDGYMFAPLVTEVNEPDDPLIQRELPFPCVTVAPYHPIRSAKILSGSLVVTLYSRLPDLIEPILKDTSISNVYVGDISTTWMSPLIPHDDYLSDFLMCNRGFIRQASWTETENKGDTL